VTGRGWSEGKGREEKGKMQRGDGEGGE